jgi:membrane-associated protease RseP (regulator of RpoE activity)
MAYTIEQLARRLVMTRTMTLVVLLAATAMRTDAAQQPSTRASRPHLQPPVLSADLLPYFARPLLGITAEQLTGPSAADAGVRDDEAILVTEIQPSSAGQRAGLRVGDVIVAIEDQTIRTVPELRTKLWENRHAREIQLAILRNQMRITIDVNLDGFRRIPPPLASNQL